MPKHPYELMPRAAARLRLVPRPMCNGFKLDYAYDDQLRSVARYYEIPIGRLVAVLVISGLDEYREELDIAEAQRVIQPQQRPVEDPFMLR